MSDKIKRAGIPWRLMTGLILVFMALAAVSTAAGVYAGFATPGQDAKGTTRGIYRGVVPIIHADISPPLRSMAQIAVPQDQPLQVSADRPTGLEGRYGP